MPVLLLLTAFLPLGCKDKPTSDPQETAAPETGGATTDDTDSGGTGETAPPALLPAVSVDLTGGAVPLTVTFDGSASVAEAGLAEVRWTFGDEPEQPDTGGADTGTGGTTCLPPPGATDPSGDGDPLVVSHTYLWSGDWTATLTLTDAAGQTASASVTVAVDPPACPAAGEPQEFGAVESSDLVEASGVVESRRTPGVLWSHNDAGNDRALFAMSTTGRHLGTWSLVDARGDPEDLAILVEDGVSVIYLGAIGDNGLDNEAAWVYRVLEPELPDPEAGQPLEETVAAEELTLTYPDGVAYDAEALMIDPLTGDLLIVTKDYEGPAEVFRKPAPHAGGEAAVLEHVASLDFSQEPLFGGATTGADVSPDGGQVVIRTYFPAAYLWIRDGSVPLWEAIRGEPCEILLPVERQGESVGYAADGSGLFTVSEGEHQPVWFTPLEPPESAPAR